MVRLIIFAVLFSFGCLGVLGQDLGSSNKLFPGVKKKGSPAKPAAKPPKSAAKKTTPASTTSSSVKTTKKPPSSAKDKTANRSTAKKSVNISKSTGPKPDPKKGAVNESTASTDKKKSAGESKANSAAGKSVDALTKNPSKKEEQVQGLDAAAAAEKFEEFILSGNTARDDRDYVAAEAAYLKAKTLKPKDSRAVYGLGNLYSDQLRWQEAEKQYRQAIAMTPNDAVAHIALSYVLVQPVAAPNLADRYEEAEKLARRALELAPANALAFDQLGVSLELRGFIGEETEKAYRKAIELDPSFAPPHAHLGRLLRRRGKNKEASVAYQNAVDRSREVGTKIIVAEVLQSEQRFSESETLLRAALKDDERNPTALLLLARALITAAKYDEAEDVLKMALSIGANGFMTNSQLAGIYLRQGKLEAAESALLQASRFVSELDRRSLSQTYESVGDAYMKLGNNRNAERAFKQAISFDSETDILSGKLSRAQQGRFGPGN